MNIQTDSAILHNVAEALIPAGTAFGDLISDTAKQVQVKGFSANGNNGYLQPIMPEYEFPLAAFRRVHLWWMTTSENPSMPDFMKRGPKKGLLISGPTGSGKTTLIEQYLARLSVPCVPYTANEHSEVRELCVNFVPTESGLRREEGPLVKAMRAGVPFICNEIDLMDPAQQTGLNDVIERGRLVVPDTDEVIFAKPGFGFVGTMNTNGQGDELGAYSGTQRMNDSLINRCWQVRVDYLKAEQEVALLTNLFPEEDDPSKFDAFVQVANAIRDSYNHGSGASMGRAGDNQTASLSRTFSTRALVSWVELTSILGGQTQSGAKTGVLDAMEAVFTGLLSQAEGAAVEALISTAFESWADNEH